ncbi:ammonium transporter [Gimesia aquarii]|uniref:histidine kinase n=1 Tax=Gimesia aquarii TaxID=2527964 RepID=A0A517WNP1_9PLAN|nr:ammonium transporter [Gimesia aquarii]QDU06874.1 Autoinducer 2 sensor kinase/phosphatase LuxQ [Gimesia aquarii]
MSYELTTNTIWVLTCTSLVFLMQAGFCCLESGLSRSKNSINVVLKNIVDFFIGALLFWLLGYGLMFGNSFHGLLGTSHFAFEDSSNTHWMTVVFLFQLVFCGTAMTISSGAVAERMKFRSYLFLACAIGAIVYPLFGHWAWAKTLAGDPSGWLGRLGFIDFAGSTVVHSVGAWSALATVLILGPRTGRFSQKPNQTHFSSSNLPLAGLGVLLIWLGWFGFNGGSTLALNSEVPVIFLNTILAGISGGLCALFWVMMTSKQISVEKVFNGSLAGLVAITASCNAVSYTSAILIGAIAGVVMLASVHLLEKRFQVDDVVGAIPVHGFAGAWGTLAVAIFADIELFQNGVSRVQQFGVQALGVVTCFLWSFGVIWICMSILNRFKPIRVTVEEEKIGLNVVEHGASTELHQLLKTMVANEKGENALRADIDSFSEAGIVGYQYNRVLDAQEVLLANVKDRETRYRSIMDNVIDAVITMDPRGFIEEFNLGAEQLFGYQNHEAIGKNIDLLIPPQQEQRQDKNTIDALNPELRKAIGARQEIIAQRKDGSTFSAELALSSVVLADRNIFTGIIQDISKRKEYEKSLNEARYKAEAANQAKSEFLANMSHEIRTPMNSILGFADILLGNLNDEENIESATIVKRNGEHLIEIINDILDLSKIEAGKITLENMQINTREIVSDIASLMQFKADSKGLNFIISFQNPIPETITSDPTRLRQILINLLGNAIKFTKSGSVELRTQLIQSKDASPQLQFDIIDTGIGLSEEAISQIYQPFTQADNSTTRKFGGTGLGLTITKRLVEMLGGMIQVKSTVNQGSTFTVTVNTGSLEAVPLLQLDENSITKSSSEINSHQLLETSVSNSTPKALIVEDGVDNQRLISFLLKKEDIDVDLAENGKIGYEQAIVKFENGAPYDFILMDMQMPVMDGYTATRKLRDAGYLSPIIALTAHAMKHDMEKCLDAGCDAYATKPIQKKKLMNIIAQLMAQELESHQG